MEEKRIPIRIDKEILKLAQRKRQITQAKLAETLGIKQNAMSGNMNRARMSLGMFSKILDTLGYDVVVIDRESGEPEWQLYVERVGELDDDI